MKRAMLFATLLAVPSVAHAQEPPRSRLELYGGPKLIDIHDSSLSIDGQSRPRTEQLLGIGLDVGARIHLVSLLSLQVGASVGRYSSDLSDTKYAEERTGLDLAAGPVLSGILRPKRPYLGWRVGLPIGPSWAWLDESPGFAVEERFGAGRGINGSLIGALELFTGRHGGYAEVGLTMTWLRFEHTAWLKADPSVQRHELYRFTDTSLVLGWGYAYRF